MSKQTLEYRYKLQRLEVIGRMAVPIVNTVCVAFVLVVFAVCGYKSLCALSGKSTTADILLKFFANIQMDRWTAYAFAALSGGYGYGQHRLRKRTIKQKSERIQQLEQMLNPARKSSMLASDGSSRTGDVI